jgi:hypothetical protein
MFSAPSRIVGKGSETFFRVEVSVSPLGVELEYTNDGLVYNKDAQSRFRTLQNLVLSELAKQKELFKNPPTLASLEAITPNWGFVSSGGVFSFSPYAELQTDIDHDRLPCLADIQLKCIEISRSTIRPYFKLHYLGPKKNEIDFEWVPPVQQKPPAISPDDIMEVSDVFNEKVGPSISLKNPVDLSREKAEAKAKINSAFQAAKEARAAAEAMAAEFYETYDLSDSESAFTEWLSDSDAESDSE